MNINSIEILLVEDHEEDAELTIRELKKNNLANFIHRVVDGEEALEFVHGEGRYQNKNNAVHVPKLIMLDIQLPKVSGIEILAVLKADELTRDIPVIILTSSKDAPDIQECYKLGINSFILKPITFEDFVHAIKQVGLYWLLLDQPF